MYHVERVRDGRSFATRTVQARQRGICIFTTSISFVRENSGGKHTIQHALPLPKGVKKPSDDCNLNKVYTSDNNPFITYHDTNYDQQEKKIHEKKVKHWMKAKGDISEAGGHQAHLIALAYISDSHFLGTVTVIHDYFKYPSNEKKGFIRKLDNSGDPVKVHQVGVDLQNGSKEHKSPFELGMLVSLDHTIYFHEPRKFKADEWMLFDMASPWSGQGRGVVMQHIFTADGTLIATCHQEGILRLSKPKSLKDSKL